MFCVYLCTSAARCTMYCEQYCNVLSSVPPSISFLFPLVTPLSIPPFSLFLSAQRRLLGAVWCGWVNRTGTVRGKTQRERGVWWGLLITTGGIDWHYCCLPFILVAVVFVDSPFSAILMQPHFTLFVSLIFFLSTYLLCTAHRQTRAGFTPCYMWT